MLPLETCVAADNGAWQVVPLPLHCPKVFHTLRGVVPRFQFASPPLDYPEFAADDDIVEREWELLGIVVENYKRANAQFRRLRVCPNRLAEVEFVQVVGGLGVTDFIVDHIESFTL
jgi:hypothetical protein